MPKNFWREIVPEELKKFLNRELAELRENKIRAIAIGVLFVGLLIYWFMSDEKSEEIILTEEPSVTKDELPVAKDLFVKVSSVEKSPDGVTPVLGANSDTLFVGDPFEVEEKIEAEPSPPPPVIPPPPIPQITPPVVIQPPSVIEKPAAPKEQVVLTGVAISGETKMAMILRDKETLFLTVGEEIGGRKIIDITPEFVTLDDGERVYMQKELR